MRWRFVLKKLLDDRVVGAVIVVAVLASVLVLYEGKAVADPDLEPGLASDAGALLAMRGSFEGDASLNWEADTPHRDLGRREDIGKPEAGYAAQPQEALLGRLRIPQAGRPRQARAA